MRYRRMYPALLCFVAFWAAFGFLMDDPANILPGLWKIIITEDALITDYVEIAGPGAAFVNSALVTLISVIILYLSKDPLNGYTMVEIGLMAGFSLFGKNIVNIWPIIGGTWLYSKVVKEPFSKHVSISLLATALAPVVSYMSLDNGWGNPLLGIAVGMAIGFVLPSLSAYTYKIQNGMNLYNMGFACGLLALMLVPLMNSMGASLETAHHWATGYNLPFGLMMAVLCSILIIAGLFFCGRPAWAAWAGYRRLLISTGRAPSDYLRMFGSAPVLINVGVNGLLGTALILITGGDLNGPTLGGILTIMGFSAFGKHARNILPVMAGVVLGGVFMKWGVNHSSVQLAMLFGTTLAPISGYFGWPFGIAAGFLHSAVVLHAGTPVEGINLYNNGFSGGLIAIVLFPLITTAIRHRQPELQDADYFDAFEHDTPIVPPPVKQDDD
ncbi:MAG: DUF1576 domain-containing protein [Flavonifractor sp.]|nr:DUF1576 domain-containing protein [Flavonifractor sp.]MCI9425818.1 DUF1576 domain-containing protein [Flavonifractor sp.]